jgi:hypothetical protein
MIYVYPARPRSLLVRFLLWPLVAAEVLWLHPRNGTGYAVQWANRSFSACQQQP